MTDFDIVSLSSSAVQNRSIGKIGERKALNDTSFSQWLNHSIQQVNSMQQKADAAARDLVTGQNKDIHGTMITMQKADIAMSLMMEVRNKIISAYDEIKRMQF